MIKAAKPRNEADRITALERYDVLDTLSEEAYNDIARIASKICGVPIAVISLVDRERQWFKASIGLDATETSRDVAFCSHAILQEKIMVVPDAKEDERFHDNPLVTDGPKIRFYAGAPLETGDGFRIGTLCVIDDKPRTLDPDQAATLAALSRQVMCLLEHRMSIATLNATSNDLLKARDEALRVSESKSAYLANMSHEFRTPMAGIMGMTEHLRGTSMTNEQLECLESIDTSAKSLLRLVNDILDSAKIEAGKLEIENVDFDLDRTLREVEMLYTHEVQKKNLQFELQAPRLEYMLKGDSLRIRQVLLNFVSNAMKFTSEGRVRLDVQRLAADNKKTALRFCVRDTGAGIPLDKIDKLFKEFSQADLSTARMHGGTGLGLSISKRLVDLMGGTIGVESMPGVGSTFWFEIELENGTRHAGCSRQPAAASKIETVFTREEASAYRILVADDNEVNRKVISRSLELLGFNVEVVSNGVEAIDALESKHFDTVLMDCQMPELDGYAATKMIRNRLTLYRNIPIIAITAGTEVELVSKTATVGMNDFLAKPFTRDKILEKLSTWLKSNPFPEARA